MRRLDGITDSVDVRLSKLREIVKDIASSSLGFSCCLVSGENCWELLWRGADLGGQPEKLGFPSRAVGEPLKVERRRVMR